MANALTEVFALLGFEFDRKGLEDAESGVKGFLAGLTKHFDAFKKASGIAAGLFAGKEIAESVVQLAELDDEAAKTAQSLGLSVQAFRTYSLGARLAGGSSEGFRMGLNHLSATLAEAQTGSKDAAKELTALGLGGFKDIKTLDDALPLLFEHFADMPAGIIKTGAAIKLFGRSGAQMIPFLNEGADGLKELKERFADLAGVVTDADAKKSEELVDSVTNLGAAWIGFKREVLKALRGPLMAMIKWVTDSIVGLRKLEERTHFFRRALTSIAAVAGLFMLRATFSLLSSLVPKVTGYVLAFTRGITLAGAAAKAQAAFMLLGWFILANLVEDFVSFLQGKDSAIGDAIDGWFGEGSQEKVRAFFTSAWKEVSGFFKDLFSSSSKFDDDFKLLIETLVKDLITGPLQALKKALIIDPLESIKTSLGKLHLPGFGGMSGGAPSLPASDVSIPTSAVMGPGSPALAERGSTQVLAPVTVNQTLPAGTPMQTVNAAAKGAGQAASDRIRQASQALDYRRP